MFPQVPENLDALSASEVWALIEEFRVAIVAACADPDLNAEGLNAIEEANATRDSLKITARAKQYAEANQEEETPVEVEAVEDETDDPDDPDDPDEVTEDDDEEEETPVGVGAHAVAPRVRTSMSAGAHPTSRAVERVRHDQLLKVGSRDVYESWTEIGAAFLDRCEVLDPGSPEKVHIARALGEFDDDHRLSENLYHNLRLFDDEITAAMCAPSVNTYNLGCANSARRPVRNSLAAFQPAQRGAVTIYPSPTLEQITTGVGVWTATDDANPNAVKQACATIQCATPVEYRLYGIYRCITIKNLLQMTFPELVEAYLNRLAAAWARLAEVTLLNAMGTAADSTTVQNGLGYGGSVSVARAILQYLTAYQELQRWDSPEMDAWMHRGVLNGIKADIVSRRRTDGGRNTIPSDAEVNAIFTNAGVTPHWTLDVANWMSPLAQFEVNNVLRPFPRNVEILVAPRGKFAVLDRGELNIGVSGNGMYRDNTSNSRNEFTFFFENYEGVVNTDSCPAHILDINNVCFNGQQIADILIGCEGNDVLLEDSGQA